jgi:malonyl-CoA O-methyltransferase
VSEFNRLIGGNFSRSANTYLDNAAIQQNAALMTLDKINSIYNTGLILDLGSGPGTFLYKKDTDYQKNIILFDLSPAMLKEAEPGIKVNGNAEYLPFANMSFNLVVSSLMLQWPKNKHKVIQEIYRVTKPGSHAIITLLIKPSLDELQKAWSQVDNHLHTLEFMDCSFYRQLFMKYGFKEIDYLSWQKTYFFENLKQLLTHFKLTGTSLPQASRNKNMCTKGTFAKLGQAYLTQSTDAGLPLSYHFLRLIVIRE